MLRHLAVFPASYSLQPWHLWRVHTWEQPSFVPFMSAGQPCILPTPLPAARLCSAFITLLSLGLCLCPPLQHGELPPAQRSGNTWLNCCSLHTSKLKARGSCFPFLKMQKCYLPCSLLVRDTEVPADVPQNSHILPKSCPRSPICTPRELNCVFLPAPAPSLLLLLHFFLLLLA